MKNYVHYTMFGVSSQPKEADVDGFLAYREEFESLPEEEWTDAEVWIYEAEKAVKRRRE